MKKKKTSIRKKVTLWEIGQIWLKQMPKEEYIFGINELDCINRSEAEQRYDFIVKAGLNLNFSKKRSYLIILQAISDAENGWYNHKLAIKYQKYRSVYWRARKKMYHDE